MASQLLLLAATSIKRKLQQQDSLRQSYDFDSLPPLLVSALSSGVADEHVYAQTTLEYNEAHFRHAQNYIPTVPPGTLGHSDIDCITSESAFSSLCGYSFYEFDRYYHSMKNVLDHCFPRSPDGIPTQSSITCTKRMKLFLFLFRCKVAASFQQMEGLFGWAKSAIHEWFTALAEVVPVAMNVYNKNFMLWKKNSNWQRLAATEWARDRLSENVFPLYQERIVAQNAHARSKGHPDPIPDNVIGSLGAADGTISICPKISSQILVAQGEDPNSDRMYCEYKKVHGWKMLAFVSHCPGPSGKKYLLKVKSSVGSCFDGTLYASMIDQIADEMIPGSFFLGDHAFHGQRLALCPYSTADIAAAVLDGNRMSTFNHNHSSSRMCSEHGMRYLKSWGVIRGRSDQWLFSTNNVWENVLNSVWSLHNYQVDGCPLMMF
jgi:hypothetical protein